MTSWLRTTTPVATIKALDKKYINSCTTLTALRAYTNKVQDQLPDDVRVALAERAGTSVAALQVARDRLIAYMGRLAAPPRRSTAPDAPQKPKQPGPGRSSGSNDQHDKARAPQQQPAESDGIAGLAAYEEQLQRDIIQLQQRKEQATTGPGSSLEVSRLTTVEELMKMHRGLVKALHAEMGSSHTKITGQCEQLNDKLATALSSFQDQFSSMDSQLQALTEAVQQERAAREQGQQGLKADLAAVELAASEEAAKAAAALATHTKQVGKLQEEVQRLRQQQETQQKQIAALLKKGPAQAPGSATASSAQLEALKQQLAQQEERVVAAEQRAARAEARSEQQVETATAAASTAAAAAIADATAAQELKQAWRAEDSTRLERANTLLIRDVAELTPQKRLPSHWSQEDLRAVIRPLLVDKIKAPAAKVDEILQRARLSGLPLRKPDERHFTVAVACATQADKQTLLRARRAATEEGLPKFWHHFTRAQGWFYKTFIYPQWVLATQQRHAAVAGGNPSRSTAVHVDYRTMVLRVGGVAWNEADGVQALRLGKKPGETWEEGEGPAGA
jgi:hypothetical protein